MAQFFGIKLLKAYPLHPQANVTVQRWNRTLIRHIASFMSTGLSDWDQQVALACYRYNASQFEATGMRLIKAMFGDNASETWGELEIDAE